MQDQREKAIPVFDPFLMGDNFKRFLMTLDGPVLLYEYLYSIMTLENPKESFFVLLLFTNIIIYFE